MDEIQEKTCLVCKRSDKEIPLFHLTYKGKKFQICSQHIPIIIHNPKQLIGRLEGAEDMKPANDL